jgi:drug/metabolite transporter (DMT)-like permease
MDWFVIAFISATLSAASTLVEKKSLFSLGALEFSYILSIVVLILSFPFFLDISYSSITSESLIILFAKTILGTFAFFFVMTVIKNLEISEALPLMILTPGFIAVFAYITIGDSLTTQEVFGIILLLIGTYILETSNRKNIFEPFLVLIKSSNHRFVIAAILLFTITSILDRVLLTDLKMSAFSFIAFQHLFLALNFTIFFLIVKKRFNFKFSPNVKANQIWLWIIAAAVLTVGYRYTQVEAIKLAPVALVLSVKRISVFFSTLIGGKIFKEKNLLRKAAATAIMVAGAVMLVG